MDQLFYDALVDNPIIAAVKDDAGLEKVCALEEIEVVFILYGDICNIPKIVQKLKNQGKIAIVHVDLISGFSAKEISVDFIKMNTCADGIISTKIALIHRAKELGLYAILRFFVIDSIALENIAYADRQPPHKRPDCVEILPGIMPKVIKKVKHITKYPIISSGLIVDKEDIVGVLEAGAMAISSTNEKVWKM